MTTVFGDNENFNFLKKIPILRELGGFTDDTLL